MNDMESGQSKGGKTIKGEVFRVEGDDYFVKRQNGKEVWLHTDETTQRAIGISDDGTLARLCRTIRRIPLVNDREVASESSRLRVTRCTRR